MIHRRFVLDRDPPFDVEAALTEIARITGWGASEMAFVLNVSRGTLRNWRERGSRPNIDDGDALRKLLSNVTGSIEPHDTEKCVYKADASGPVTG